MTLEELGEAVYEDLNGRISSVSSNGDTYLVHFECNDWRDDDRTRRFELTFAGVSESTVTPSSSEIIQLANDHPLLWRHNDEHVSMYFSSSPNNPAGLIGELYEAHEQLLGGSRKLGDCLHASTKLLTTGHGLLAQGPRQVIDAYARAIGDRLSYSTVSGHKPRGGYRVAIFDEGFIVFREASIVEFAASESSK